jgi:3-hydroxyacyl-[acyl-carrier-protein] dehydratase
VRLEIDVLNWRTRMMRMQGKAYVDGKLICEGIVTSQMVPRTRPIKSETASDAANAPQEAAVEA